MSTDRTNLLKDARFWALALSAALVLGLFPLAGAGFAQEQPDDPSDACPEDPEEAPFDDRDEIPEAHVRNVDCAYEREIVFGFGDNTYRPRLNVRRDQMAGFIARTITEAGHELPPPEQHPGFLDTQGNTHEDDIRRLAAAEIVFGGPGDEPPTNYGPALDVRRDQMASFLIRSAEFAFDRDFGETDQRFPDVPPENVHFENVNGAHEQGLTAGRTDGTYAPAESTRRDQMASFVVRLLHFLETFDPEEPTPDPTPEGTPGATPEPATATGALEDVPELVSVTHTAGATTATVVYTFDEDIDAEFELDEELFLLYGPNTADQRFTATSVELQGTDAVVAEFPRAAYDAATTAAVAAGAVQTEDEDANPEKGLGLKSAVHNGRTIVAGAIYGPLLVSATADDGPLPGTTEITWVFDRDVTDEDAEGALVVYMANGTRITEPGGPPSGGFTNCGVEGREITCTGLFGETPVLAAVEYDAARDEAEAFFGNYEQSRLVEDIS